MVIISSLDEREGERAWSMVKMIASYQSLPFSLGEQLDISDNYSYSGKQDFSTRFL